MDGNVSFLFKCDFFPTWQLKLLGNGDDTEVYTCSHPKARIRCGWYCTAVLIWHRYDDNGIKVYTCSHSRIRCDRWYWKYSAFYWQFWDATHTEQCVQGIQFNNMDLEGGQFGDSQFFWKCPQCSQLHMSTCRSSDEPFAMVTGSTRLVLPGWSEASNGRSCHLQQLKYKMQPCRVN